MVTVYVSVGNAGGRFTRFHQPCRHQNRDRNGHFRKSKPGGCLTEWEWLERGLGQPSQYGSREPAITAWHHDAGASWRAIRCGSLGAPARRHACAVRVPGVTFTTTMRQPHVPRLSTDALRYRTPLGRVWGPHKERLKGPQCEFMDSGHGSMNCANSVKPPRGVLGVESECMVWVQGCRGSVLGLMEVSFHR